LQIPIKRETSREKETLSKMRSCEDLLGYHANALGASYRRLAIESLTMKITSRNYCESKHCTDIRVKSANNARPRSTPSSPIILEMIKEKNDDVTKMEEEEKAKPMKTSPVTAAVNTAQTEFNAVVPSHDVASGYAYFINPHSTLGQLRRKFITAVNNLAYSGFNITAAPRGSAPSNELNQDARAARQILEASSDNNELAPESHFNSQPVNAIQTTASAEAEFTSKILHREANQIAVSLSRGPSSFLDRINPCEELLESDFIEVFLFSNDKAADKPGEDESPTTGNTSVSTMVMYYTIQNAADQESASHTPTVVFVDLTNLSSMVMRRQFHDVQIQVSTRLYRMNQLPLIRRHESNGIFAIPI
jgi:hypothetical protein